MTILPHKLHTRVALRILVVFIVAFFVSSFCRVGLAKNNTFNDTDVKKMSQLSQDFSRLSNDVSKSQHGIEVTNITGLEKKSCLANLSYGIGIINEANVSPKLLISLSKGMTEQVDEMAVNTMLVLSIDHLQDVFSVVRENANSVGGACSGSPLVNSYSQELKKMMDQATPVLDEIKIRANKASL